MTDIVLFKPKPSVDPTAVEKLRQALTDLVAVFPGLLSFAWGVNVSPEGKSQGYELGFVMTFNTAADRDAYLPHPDHVAVRPFVQEVAAETLVYDLETRFPSPHTVIPSLPRNLSPIWRTAYISRSARVALARTPRRVL